MGCKTKLSVRNRVCKKIFVDIVLVLMLLASCSIFLVEEVLATGWDEQDKLLPTDISEMDRFGYSVSISGDYALIGSHWDDDNGDKSGSAYVFYNDGDVWTQQAKLLADDGALNDVFGFSVSISGDYAIVGAYGDDVYGDQSGSAYVFERSGSSWTQQAKLLADDGALNDVFGFSVSISGDYALVGAKNDGDNGVKSGSAYVFYNDGDAWTQQAKLLADDGAADDQFGYSVSISGDYAIVGAITDDDNGDQSGSAYVFERSGSSWTQQAKLLADDGAADDQFGVVVSISGDYALIGALRDDDYGDKSGSAYVFHNSQGVWTQQAKLLADDGAADDFFGVAVSISGDYAIVGAYGDDDGASGSGSAYVFECSGSSWTQQAKLLADDGAQYDQFGRAVSISGDYALIGAYGDDDYTGSAYILINANNPPNTPSTPSGTNSVTVDAVYSYSTSATDPDGDQVFYKFTWGDGFDSGWVGPYDSGETGSASHSWNAAGTYHVTATTKDSNDEESESSGYLIVSVSVQELPVLSYSPTEINFGTLDEGSTDSKTFNIWNSGEGTLTYSLSETMNWVEINPSSGNSTGEHDTVSVNVVNTDNMDGYYSGLISISSDGGNDSVFVNITIGSSQQINIPPTADAGRSYTGIANETITFTGWGSDSDGTIAYYRWDFNNDGIYDTGRLISNIANYSYSSAGVYTAKLEVIDNLGANATDTVTVTITEDSSSDTDNNSNDNVTTDGNSSDTGDKDTPGFELIFVFCALIIVVYLNKKRKNNSGL